MIIGLLSLVFKKAVSELGGPTLCCVFCYGERRLDVVLWRVTHPLDRDYRMLLQFLPAGAFSICIVYIVSAWFGLSLLMLHVSLP